ncbi:perlucin-like [Sitophilus oryzae]|uniref:Perlucin-like n=1 Tax=Sitophilus oryzae TaxID=7048 RepID=A0A6J2Y2E7_SITOR|nr:perlucin-like [Sitophilus oryzae]
MKCVIGVLVLAFCATAYPNDLVPLGASTSYYVSTTKKSFIGAWINCKTGGMDLASVTTAAEQAELNTTVGSATGDGEGYWLGGVAENVSGDWYWSDSARRVIYTNWGTGQPRDYGSEGKGSCIRLGNFYGTSQPLLWQAVSCEYKLYFICKYTSS